MVIADEKKILAIAGVIGGKSSGATETTKNILIEAATFDPVSVRKTSQRLGIRTDSSVRFEKGVDPTLPYLSSLRYEQLLTYYIPDALFVGEFTHTTEQKEKSIQISHNTIESRLGQKVDQKIIIDILSRLGFSVTEKSETYTVQIPSWRNT